MTNPFEDIAAYSPLFTDLIKVTAKRREGNAVRTISGSYRGCVFPAEDAEAMLQESADSDLKTFRVLIAKLGPNAWNDKTQPQIGDIIEFKGGVRAAVKKVDPLVADWYEMEARQC